MDSRAAAIHAGAMHWLLVATLAICLGLTLLILWGCRQFSPFRHPGETATEGAIVFLPLLFLRFLLLGGVVLTMAWGSFPRLVGALAAHCLVGMSVMYALERWLSVGYEKTRARNAIWAAWFFLVPIAVIAGLWYWAGHETTP